MPIQPLIDYGRLKRVGPYMLEVSPREFEWRAIFYPGRVDRTLYCLENDDWDILKKLGFGITSCTLIHDSTHFTQIRCEGKHPNMHPHDKMFCTQSKPNYTLESAIQILHALSNPNFHSWFETEWGVDKWTSVFDLIDNNDQEGRTMKIS